MAVEGRGGQGIDRPGVDRSAGGRPRRRRRRRGPPLGDDGRGPDRRGSERGPSPGVRWGEIGEGRKQIPKFFFAKFVNNWK